MANRHAGDRVERHGFRQSGAERVETAGARGERPVPRLAQAQRFFRLLPLVKLEVGAGARCLGIRPRAIGFFVQACAIQCAGDVTPRAEQEFAFVAFDAPDIGAAHHHRADRPARHDERDDDLFAAHHEIARAHGLPSPARSIEQADRIADRVRQLEFGAVIGRHEQRAGRRVGAVQQFRQARTDHLGRCSCTRERRHQLLQSIRVPELALRFCPGVPLDTRLLLEVAYQKRHQQHEPEEHTDRADHFERTERRQMDGA